MKDGIVLHPEHGLNPSIELCIVCGEEMGIALLGNNINMFTKEERLFIWKKVYEMIDRLEDGEYICVALRNVVFMYFKEHKNIYEFRSDEMVRIYFPELEEKIGMATEPEETRTFYGWFGCISPETKEVRLNIVKDIIKELG